MSSKIKEVKTNEDLSIRFKKGCAWVDGNYLPIEKASIPIMDVGFTKSDCTYDVVATWKGKFF